MIKNISITLVSLFLVACASGKAAIEKMSPEQKEFLSSKLMLITPDMAEPDLVNLLGPIYRGAGTSRPVWLGPHKNESSQIAIYFSEGKIFKVRWMDLGSFTWEAKPRSE